MKKLLLLVLLLASINAFSQTLAFWCVEIKAKPRTEKYIEAAFEKAFKEVKYNKANFRIQKISTGPNNGMTHRIIWHYTLGTEPVDTNSINIDRDEAFWAKMFDYVETWGHSYSGRFLSWKSSEKKDSIYHIWDFKIKDQAKFKNAHDLALKDLKEEFAGRAVGFGTYDIGRPNGATHWIGVSCINDNDHLLLIEKLEKNPRFIKYLQDRGEVEDVKDYMIEDFKVKN